MVTLVKSLALVICRGDVTDISRKHEVHHGLTHDVMVTLLASVDFVTCHGDVIDVSASRPVIVNLLK